MKFNSSYYSIPIMYFMLVILFLLINNWKAYVLVSIWFLPWAYYYSNSFLITDESIIVEKKFTIWENQKECKFKDIKKISIRGLGSESYIRLLAKVN